VKVVNRWLFILNMPSFALHSTFFTLNSGSANEHNPSAKMNKRISRVRGLFPASNIGIIILNKP
jgi:hypothetical protein